ncbi:MAG TPA: hypothetical protein VEX18_14255 [Polyangiaceae bacterium]|nr:hypothetical protein [Polyangiaceae bacterium]
MTLSSQGRRVMVDARAALGPSATERARIRQSLAARVAAGAAASASVSLFSSIVAAVTPKAVAVTVGGLAVALTASFGYLGRSDVPAQHAPSRPTPTPVSSAPRSAPTDRNAEPAAQLEPAPESSHRGSAQTGVDVPQAGSSRSGKTSAAASTPGVPDVAGEIAVLAEAQKALAADQPARALSFLDDHARAFPQGALSEERSLARVIALCKLGRSESARRAARPLLRKAPDSPVSERIRAACGNAVASAADDP